MAGRAKAGCGANLVQHSYCLNGAEFISFRLQANCSPVRFLEKTPPKTLPGGYLNSSAIYQSSLSPGAANVGAKVLRVRRRDLRDCPARFW
jgi:hypothetical protein